MERRGASAMSFVSRKQQGSDGGLPHDHRAVDRVRSQQSRHWHAWRRSAQKVTRAWNAWLAAADGRQRAEFYNVLVSALSEEERAAAEVERACVAR